ncbi:aldose epimerase family protein [Alkalibacterium sp. MB6]|uniref:aldose epimerase family protein n=1 Tax=Alkalibacterium sp. MB6 TaxID=2081965 RepID=UPI001379F56C|nr:aldose epimerase family protein [Alkalibacterium sp. MB6]
MELTTSVFGKVNGVEVNEYTLTNSKGVSLSAIPYGATLTKLVTPDKNGNKATITVNADNLDDIVANRPFYGATIGRVAGRIAKGQFSLSGKDYQVDINEGDNMLHGGPEGLDTKLWTVDVETAKNEGKLVFTYLSPDGENNFPGNLSLKTTFTLTEDNEWIIDYEATTDQTTLYNPTNHVYFNLTGDVKQSIANHRMKLKSKYYATLLDDNLPTGDLVKSEGTPFDFSTYKSLSEAIHSDDSEIKRLNGLDHPFVLEQDEGVKGSVYDPESGREVFFDTDCNSVVIFTHNGEVDSMEIDGESIREHAGITLETQTLPDAVNQPGFGNIVLQPGETFRSTTTYTFGIKE